MRLDLRPARALFNTEPKDQSIMTNTDATAATATRDFALPPIPSRRTQGLEEGLPAALYAGGATALRDFLRPLGLTAFKFGLSGRRYVNARILDLRARRYASIVADLANRDATLVDHPLGREWFLSPLPDPAADRRPRRGLRNYRTASFAAA